jgi:hypothetical protein
LAPVTLFFQIIVRLCGGSILDKISLWENQQYANQNAASADEQGGGDRNLERQDDTYHPSHQQHVGIER